MKRPTPRHEYYTYIPEPEGDQMTGEPEDWTDYKIRQLREHASSIGDYRQVKLCNIATHPFNDTEHHVVAYALGGVWITAREAYNECVRVFDLLWG